jgi:parvulin-like peptidyl-prolyl isomerase
VFTALLLGALAGPHPPLGALALGGQEAEETQAKGQRPPAQAPNARIRPKGDRAREPHEVIFRIGGDAYLESDFLAYLPYMMHAGRAEQVKRDPRLLSEARRAYTDQMLLLAQARKEGLDKTPEFQERLAGVTRSLLVQEAKKKLPTADGVHPTDEQMLAHYEKFIDNYKAGEKATARHILVKVKGDKDGKGKPGDAKALAALEKARKELKSGKGWAEVAKKYSEDPASKDKGGLMENFDPARMVPEFAEAVRKQDIGAVGPPVKTQHGYHMIVVEGREPARAQTFDEAKDRVRTQVVNALLTDAWAAYFDSLKAEYGFSEGDDPQAKAKEPEPQAPAKGPQVPAKAPKAPAKGQAPKGGGK